ncbi:MAG: ACT domain-containing protein [Georgfuchsia sp.]
MPTYLVLTVIGNDRPGLVEELSTTISACQGNWLEASMSHLAGQFAGIVRVELPDAQVEPLQGALLGLADLKITTAASSSGNIPAEGRTLLLSLVGHDRIGIVREVTQVLARHAVNVEKLTSYTASAPMSAETLFHANAELRAAPTLDARALKTELENLSDDLMVDISIVETF